MACLGELRNSIKYRDSRPARGHRISVFPEVLFLRQKHNSSLALDRERFRAAGHATVPRIIRDK